MKPLGRGVPVEGGVVATGEVLAVEVARETVGVGLPFAVTSGDGTAAETRGDEDKEESEEMERKARAIGTMSWLVTPKPFVILSIWFLTFFGGFVLVFVCCLQAKEI